MNNSLHWLKPCQAGEPVLVCVHGWGASVRVWQPLAEQVSLGVLAVQLPGFDAASELAADNLTELAYTDYIEHLAQSLLALNLKAHPVYFVGWSLGGQIAASLAAQLLASDAAITVGGVITLASNPCFVANKTWPSAMARPAFKQFCQSFKSDPSATLKRFNALQAQGSQNPRALRQSQKTFLPAAPLVGSRQQAHWLNALVWLQQDTRPVLECLQVPQLHVVAQHDALVPANNVLAAFGEVITLAHSHCLPLDAPKPVARAIDVFIKTHRQQALSKQKVAAAFSGAARRYDAFARVQKTVAKQVLNQLPEAHNKVVLDVGSGTGALTQGLLALTNPKTLYCIDIAAGMLEYARTHALSGVGAGEQAGTPSTYKTPPYYIAADAELLPLASQSIDGIMSSLAIQWCENPNALMAEFYRVMKPGAWAVIATLGPNTLHELKAAWQAVDDCVHVNAFASRAQLLQASAKAGFTVELERETQCCDYPSLAPLLKELKAIGAHNSHANAPAGLMTKTRLQQLEQNYPKTAAQSAPIVASYDVFYMRLNKPLSCS